MADTQALAEFAKSLDAPQQAPQPEPETQVEEPGTDPEAAEGASEDAETEDKGEEAKKETGYTRKARQLKELREQHETVRSTLAETIEHAKYFATRNEEIAKENADLKAKLEAARARAAEYGIDADSLTEEDPVQAENRVLKAEAEKRRRAEEMAAKTQKEQRVAQATARLVEVAKKSGVDAKTLADAYFANQGKIKLEVVAEHLRLRTETAAKAAAIKNRKAPKEPGVKQGSGGNPSSFPNTPEGRAAWANSQFGG